MKPIEPLKTKDFNMAIGTTMQETLTHVLSVFVVKINELVRAVNFLIDNQK